MAILNNNNKYYIKVDKFENIDGNSRLYYKIYDLKSQRDFEKQLSKIEEILENKIKDLEQSINKSNNNDFSSISKDLYRLNRYYKFDNMYIKHILSADDDLFEDIKSEFNIQENLQNYSVISTDILLDFEINSIEEAYNYLKLIYPNYTNC